VSFYGYDGMGNVRQLTNSAGVVTDEYEYDAYGNSFTKTGSTPNSYLYRGEQFDSDLGLYYLRARYYNPASGRFMSRDPEDGKIRILATLHKYLYANGDPVNGIDPTGRDDIISFELQVYLVAYRVELFLDTTWQMAGYYSPFAVPYVCMAIELLQLKLYPPGAPTWVPPFCM
jgi:RHS repeat-associated protein